MEYLQKSGRKPRLFHGRGELVEMLIGFSAFVTENQLKVEKDKHFSTTEQERSQVAVATCASAD